MNDFLARLAALRRNKTALNAATAIVIALAMSLLAMLAVDRISFLTGADRFVRDWEVAYQSTPEDQDPNILILSVNEQTMQNFPYRSPLDRGFLANLLTTLDGKHPKAIVLDYLFDQPTEPAKDDALRDALRDLKTPTVVSYFEANTTVSLNDVPNVKVGQSATVTAERMQFAGQDLARLTPRNNDSLLFDGIPWVGRAQEEHDIFAGALRDRGATVLYLADLLTETGLSEIEVEHDIRQGIHRLA